MKAKLLFITQKIHKNDDDLAFAILWIKEFINQGVDVQVICLEKRDFDDSFPVYSLGKEEGAGKLKRIVRFLKLIMTLRYDRVFVHMNPEYITLGGWYWFLMRKPMYLWYTHYVMHIHLWISGILCKRMFAATKQSLPQYNNSLKKVILGHGIDVDSWLDGEDFSENNSDEHNILTVHRLCRSKRLEIGINTIFILPQEYNLSVYGRDVEKDYYSEMVALVNSKGLQERIKFMGPVPMHQLKEIYPKHRLMINMASETIDKTMVEAMLFGVYPITTKGNSIAIGLPVWPEDDSPESVAAFIQDGSWRSYDKKYLQDIVKEKHSLKSLIEKLNNYIVPGI